MEPSLQDLLFQQIKSKLPPGVSLADAIADKLFISPDSAYRRIRGETALVMEEVRVLCTSYSISLDQLMHLSTGAVLFTPVLVEKEKNGFESFLKGILRNLQATAEDPDSQIIYLAKDVPLFHHFGYRPLFAFRYFFWMKSILQHPDFVSATFDLACLPSNIEKLGKEILDTYNSIPSTEIWNTECVNSTIAQIEYYRGAGYFSNIADAEIVYASLQSSLNHIRSQAEWGAKFSPGSKPGKKNLRFFYNRVVLGDNTIMALRGNRKTLYLNYDVLNYMVTEDQDFCSNVFDKLQMLMKKATIISSVSEKQRNIFFNELSAKIPSRPN